MLSGHFLKKALKTMSWICSSTTSIPNSSNISSKKIRTVCQVKQQCFNFNVVLFFQNVRYLVVSAKSCVPPKSDIAQCVFFFDSDVWFGIARDNKKAFIEVAVTRREFKKGNRLI